MKDKQKIKDQAKLARHRRVRAKVEGTAKRPRLSVFKSLKDIYAQLIDDQKGVTLASASGKEIDKKLKTKKTDLAFKVGELIAKKAGEKGIKEAVFDRGSYKYQGRVKALAEGARKGGLKF